MRANDNEGETSDPQADRSGKSAEAEGMEGGAEVITQTEIICLAIMEIDREIEYYRDRFASVDESLYEKMVADFLNKRSELRTLYQIQTGKEYD